MTAAQLFGRTEQVTFIRSSAMLEQCTITDTIYVSYVTQRSERNSRV